MGIFYDKPTKYSSDLSGSYMCIGNAPMKVGARFWKYRRFTVGIGDFVTANGDYIEQFGIKYIKVQYRGATAYIREDYLLKMHEAFDVPTTKSNSGAGTYRIKTAFTLRAKANPQSASLGMLAVNTRVISYGYYTGTFVVVRWGDKVGYFPAGYLERIGD